ncbi:gamma-interferon-inducible lysosomal thiol reductase-like [Brevipalpus obovatus]|uniref:gamma-interferon-inducible lysosomal thiol reductase-like n=1 Tax=Brevipalpus obovatus TaxID=246614 RepID=UPI003D9E6377
MGSFVLICCLVASFTLVIVESSCKFDIAVYYETRCPDSKGFLINQLYPTYKEMPDIMNIDLVPYGKASYKQNGESTVFTCQHGPKECQGNLIQACAKKYLAVDELMKLTVCMERSYAPETQLDECAKQENITQTASIQSCVSGNEGTQLLRQLGDRTHALTPKMTFVPWVTLGGVYNENFQNEAITDLKSALCDRCQGTKPAGCSPSKRRM